MCVFVCTCNLQTFSQIKKPRYFYRGSHTTHFHTHDDFNRTRNEYKCFINDARLRIELSSPDPNSGTLPLCYQAVSGETRNRTGGSVTDLQTAAIPTQLTHLKEDKKGIEPSNTRFAVEAVTTPAFVLLHGL